VDSPTAQSAQMALKLSAEHRWCVSGTPIGRGRLEDLYGLLLFLQVEPFQHLAWFKHCLQASSPEQHDGDDGDPKQAKMLERIRFLLQDIFWRSTKANTAVQIQMGIPPQEEHKVFLELSSIEKHFYEQQLHAAAAAASTVVQDHHHEHDEQAAPGSHLTRRHHLQKTQKDERALSHHLHRLRAACCHPQVGSYGLGRLASGKGHGKGGGGGPAASGLLTMDQILDRLVDDAKTKCEESQRIAVMHSNAVACLHRLQVEAKARPDCQSLKLPKKSDQDILKASCRTYMDSLTLTKTNAAAVEVVGEAMLSGCTGFLQSDEVARDGKALLEWNIQKESFTNSSPQKREVWARIDFEGPAKKLVGIQVRSLTTAGGAADRDEYRSVLFPQSCKLQVSNASVGGEFVDVCRLELPKPAALKQGEAHPWVSVEGFRTNKSKNWKIMIEDYYDAKVEDDDNGDTMEQDTHRQLKVALEVHLKEPEIATDDLQKVHILHNASMTCESLLHTMEKSDGANEEVQKMHEQLQTLQQESTKLEGLYLGAAKIVHRESQRQLVAAMQAINDLEEDFKKMLEAKGLNIVMKDLREDVSRWWLDFLTWCARNASPHIREMLRLTVQQEIIDYEYQLTDIHKIKKCNIPNLDILQVSGFLTVMRSRYDTPNAVTPPQASNLIERVAALSEDPPDMDVIENSRCHRCRKDWFQTGPTCRHCKLNDNLLDFEKQMTDPLLGCILRGLSRGVRETHPSDPKSRSLLSILRYKASFYTKWQDARKKELYCAKRAWRTHFDVFSDIDELNQCKDTIRLLRPREDVGSLSHHELNSVVAPAEIMATRMDHETKQAMAVGQLRRDKDTLRYLRNQSMERKKEMEAAEKKTSEKAAKGQVGVDESGTTQTEERPTCAVCLSTFTSERAVLNCGHCFHYSPCLERLMARNGGASTISCPMRCTVRTDKDKVMIASDKSNKDGSRIKRQIKGSWGTKVERLVSDVMDISQKGEKGIVFSQWDDLLTIVETALLANDVPYVRPQGRRKVGESVKQFRSGLASVVLLNVKSGAEGLTLVEAKHVFMVEPLLHCGLDSQAINRIHR
jgi:uncharacterized protein YukE